MAVLALVWGIMVSPRPSPVKPLQDTVWSPTLEITQTATPTYSKAVLDPSSPTLGEQLTPTANISPEPTSTPSLVLDASPAPVPEEDSVASASPSQALIPSPPVNIAPPLRRSKAESEGEYADNRVVLHIRPKSRRFDAASCLPPAGATIASDIAALSVLVVNVPEGTVDDAISRLSQCPGVRSAEPDYRMHALDTIPSDPAWPLQYGLVNIRAPQGWDISTGSSSVIIAVIDTGVDLAHPDLAAKITAGQDYVNNDSIAQDDNGHGTHVAGIAAAAANNGTGIVGVSWGALIMPVKVLDNTGNGFADDVADGIIWAADHGAQVINLSLGGPDYSQVLESAIQYAYGKGVVLVAAAGSTGSGVVLYPARSQYVIAVAATDPSNQHFSLSNYGPEVALAAPGVDIYTTSPGGAYSPLDGTSMSAPFVSGLAAILRGLPGIGSPDVILWHMESTALDLGVPGRDPLYGYGLIQMDAALLSALGAAPSEPVHQRPGALVGPAPAEHPVFNTATAASSPTTRSTSIPAATASPSSSGSSTPEMSVQAGASPRPGEEQVLPAFLGNDWPIGCTGFGLVLLGLVLALRRRKSSRRRPPGPHLQFRPR